MKNIFVILLVCVAICCSRALEHSLFYGNCVHDDQTIQLYSQIIMMNNSNTIQNSKSRKWYDWFSFNRKPTPSPRFSRKVINATIQFPPAGTKNSHIIKCIQVLDRIPDSHGAFASIVGGGVGQNATNITLISQLGGNINSQITILGYKTNKPLQPTYRRPSPVQQRPAYQQTAFGWKQLPAQQIPAQQIPQSSPNMYPNLNSNAHPQSYQAPTPHYPWPIHRKK